MWLLVSKGCFLAYNELVPTLFGTKIMLQMVRCVQVFFSGRLECLLYK